MSYNMLKKTEQKECKPENHTSLWREFCDFVALQPGHNITVCPIELNTMHTDVVHTDQGRSHSISA